MKKINLKSAAVGSVALLAGCTILDAPEYYSGGTWTVREDFEGAVADLYAYQTDNWSEEVTGTGLYSWEIASDIVTLGRAGYPHETQIRNMSWSAITRDEILCIWWRLYLQNTKANNIIRDINQRFESGNKGDMDENFKRLVIAEASFARAYAMLWLAPYYGDNGPNGGIPIITEATSADQMDSPRPASVLQNYDRIIDDFRVAADGLPYFSQLSPEWYGRAHKAAAWGLCARAAMYAAKWDASYWDVVIEMCDNIINIAALPGSSAADTRALVTTTGTYPDGSVRPSYANLFTIANNFSPEYLWSFMGNTDTDTRGPQFYAQGLQNGGWGYANTWGKFQPTWELYKAYEEGDQRRDATILKPGDTFWWFGETAVLGSSTTLVHTQGTKTAGETQVWDISSTTKLMFRKYMEPFEPFKADEIGNINCNSSRPRTKLGQVMIRYADILLMKAEALIMKNGGTSAPAAAPLINQVRTRAGLPANSTGTLAELKQERKVEFAYEFQPSRLLDLIRWGDAEVVFNSPTHACDFSMDAAGNVTIDYEHPTKIFDARTFNPSVNHVVPIPARAFNGTVNMRQNNGY